MVTISRSAQAAIWRGLRRSLRTLLMALTILLLAMVALRWYRGIGSLEDARPRVLLTLAGLAVAAWLLEILAAGVRRFPRLAIAGLIAVVVSQACYLTLVWSEWKPYQILWRAWWLSLVPAVTIGHVVWLRLTAPSSYRTGLTRAAELIAVAAAVAFGALALQPNLLEGLTPLNVGVPAGLGALSLMASIATWVRHGRSNLSPPVARGIRIGAVVAAQAAVVAVAFYAGRVTAPAPGVMDLAPSPLAHLTPAQLDAQLSADLARLRVISDGLDDLTRDANDLAARIHAAQQTDFGRTYYLPAEEDELKARFMTYLAYRSALLRLVAAYANFQSVPDPAARARCFLVGYGAGATVMRASTMLVAAYGDDPAARRKLNEPDDACGLRAGEFDRVHAAVINDRNAQTFEEMAGYFQAHRDDWRARGVLASADDFDWLAARIDRALTDVAARDIDRVRGRIELIVERVRRDAYTPYYDAQSLISTIIGDTRIVSRPSFITPCLIESIQPELRPGDILLERRNWYASNAFLPGFWPHAALYIGTIEDLERLGLARRTAAGAWTSDDPAIASRLSRYLEPAHDDEAHTVLESVSEGVIFNSLTESMGADYVAVLRPRRLTDEQRAAAIARAFAHEGKPYDFEFDFFSSDKLVCTELVYRSYQGLLDFDLVRIMGRDTLPALEIAKSFAAARDRDDRQLDFVLFLDADPARNTARRATEADFANSIHRPRGFNE